MNKNKGFTLAEIIIAMTIIGVIAAVTIPALLVATNDKALEAQKKALLARVSQAMSQIEDLRAYKKIDNAGNDSSSSLNFITKSLSKVYRITKTCDLKTLTENCAFPDELVTQNGGTFKIANNSKLSDFLGVSASTLALDTEAAGFTTANGESIVVYYNPNCRGERTNGYYSGSAVSSMCLNMIYDLNGYESAPNEVGKDIGFLTIFFPKDPDIVAPVTYSSDISSSDASYNSYADAIDACKNQSKDLIIPNWSEGMSIAVNKKLTNVDNSLYLVSGAGNTKGAYQVNMGSFVSNTSTDWSGTYKLRCIYNK